LAILFNQQLYGLLQDLYNYIFSCVLVAQLKRMEQEGFLNPEKVLMIEVMQTNLNNVISDNNDAFI